MIETVMTILGILLVLIMLRGVYVMEMKPETEKEARKNVNSAKFRLRDAIESVDPRK